MFAFPRYASSGIVELMHGRKEVDVLTVRMGHEHVLQNSHQSGYVHDPTPFSHLIGRVIPIAVAFRSNLV